LPTYCGETRERFTAMMPLDHNLPMSAGAAGRGSAHRPGVAFAGVFAVTFCGLVAVGAVLPVLPRYVHGPLDAGNVAVGVVIGSYAVTGLLLRPFAGRLADRRGRRPAVLLGSAIVAGAGFLYLLPFGVPGLIAARLLLGAGEGTVFTAGSAWIVDIAPPQRRGRVIGLYGLAVWAGLSVGPLIGELLLHASGYTAVWLFAGAAPLAGALIALRLPDPFRPGGHTERQPLIAREALRPGTALALASFGYATVASFVVLHLDARGVGHGATVFGVFATMVVLTRLIGGDLPDRVGPARVATVAAMVEAVGLATMALAHSFTVAVVGALAMGAAFSLLYPSLSLIVVGRVPETRRGAALGTFTAFFDAGIGFGAPLAGLAAVLAGYEGAFLFSAAIAVIAAATIALAISSQGRTLLAAREGRAGS
jgi:MFS family permease